MARARYSKRTQSLLHLCLLQEGEYILREGEPLATGSKFYMIEEGTVECCKTIQVRGALYCNPSTHPVVTTV